jgi:hypothetical protein
VVPNGAPRRSAPVAARHRAEDAAWLGLRRSARSTEAISLGVATNGFGPARPPDAFEVVPGDEAGLPGGAVRTLEWSEPQPDAATATRARPRARATQPGGAAPVRSIPRGQPAGL